MKSDRIYLDHILECIGWIERFTTDTTFSVVLDPGCPGMKGSRKAAKIAKEEKKELVTNCYRFQTLKHSSASPSAFTEQGMAMLGMKVQ